MTITPEKLRAIANVHDDNAALQLMNANIPLALLAAADEIERLQRDVTELMSAVNEALNDPRVK